MAKVQGHCDPAFENVKESFQQFLDSGDELGASIYVDLDGTCVLDLWGGYADQSRTRTWDEDTITCVWSSSKTITNLAALMLVDRGLLDVHEKVSKYWPEFAANGKEDLEVRNFLSHSAGLPAWEPPIPIEEIYDLEKSTALLAAQAPWWKPGTVSGYHAISQGHLVGELVRRLTGKSLKQFIDEEIAGPLGADFRLGAPEKDWPRIADVVPPPPLPANRIPPPDSVAARIARGSVSNAARANEPDYRRAALGASNGYSNARAINRIISVIAQGGQVKGAPRILSQKTIDGIFEEQTNGVDLVLGREVKWGVGFALPRPDVVDWIPEGRVAFWGGWGGSIIIADTERRLTICYVMNKMESTGTMGNPRTAAYCRAVYDSIKKLNK